MSNRELELFPCLSSLLYLSTAPKMTNRYPRGNKSRQRRPGEGLEKSLPVQKLFELLIVQSPWQIRGCQGGGLVQTEKNKTTILAGFARTRVKTNNSDKETDERWTVCCLQTQAVCLQFVTYICVCATENTFKHVGNFGVNSCIYKANCHFSGLYHFREQTALQAFTCKLKSRLWY